MGMGAEAAVFAILKSVAGSLIAKAPPAVQQQLTSRGRLQKDLESAWDQAHKEVLRANLGFGALVDEKVLARFAFQQALNPYWLMKPEAGTPANAVHFGWLGKHQADEAVKTFLTQFVESWKHTESFKALGQWFEQIEANEVLAEIRDAIVAAAEKDIRVRAAPISAPTTALLIEYCDRLSAEAITAPFLARHATERLDSRSAPAEPISLDQAFAGLERMILVGEGGIGKTTALRCREQMLAGIYAGEQGSLVPVYLKLSHYHGEELESAVAERVNGVLKGSGELLSETAEESARAMRTWLTKAPGTVAILLDGLNEVPEDHAQTFHSRLKDFLRYKQRFVLSSRDYDPDPLPGHSVPVFSLARLTPDEIRELLTQKLDAADGRAADNLSSDRTLAALCSNPFYLDLMARLLNSPGPLPENRALLLRQSIAQTRKALSTEGEILVGAAAKSEVVEAFLKALGWNMLRAGAVSCAYSTADKWNLPLSGCRLDDVMSGASKLRLLASGGEKNTPIEFRHPVFRDYFAAERIAALLEENNDLDFATDKQYSARDWRDAVRMAAGLLGAKASNMVNWLIAKDQLNLAYHCWEESPARKDPHVADQLATALRAWVGSPNHKSGDWMFRVLGEMQDPNAVSLIEQFLARGYKWAYTTAIPALEKIRSDKALDALAAALKNENTETRREAAATLRRFGADSVPALLRTDSAVAAEILHEVAPKAVDALMMAASKDPEESIRARAVLALGYTGRSEAVDVLSQCLLQDKEPWVRKNAAIALGKLRNPAAIPALQQALTYGTAGGPDDSSAAREQQESENAHVRLEAASALWKNGWAVSDAKAAFFELYQSKGWSASWRGMVLECLMDRLDHDALDLLLKACRDESEEVRQRAYALLHRVPEDVNIDDILARGLRDSAVAVRLDALNDLLKRYGKGALNWIKRALEENPSGNYDVVDLVVPDFGNDGREFLTSIIDSDEDEAVRATAVTALSRFKGPGDTVLETALLKADARNEPDLVQDLIDALCNSRNPAVLARIKSLAEDGTVAEELRTRAQDILLLTRHRAL